MREYVFLEPLKEGIVIRRKSQFTMDVMLDGETVSCHCPTTNRIGDIELKQVACLVSESKDPKRKLKYTVEAISCDELDETDKNWVGINQILSNRLVEFFLSTHQLEEMVSGYANIQREVHLGISKLDFLVGNTYLEVKTPLTTLNVVYGKHVITKPSTPFSSTERMVKHVKDLAGSLKSHERAILLTVHQYQQTEIKKRLRSTHYEEVSKTMGEAIAAGVEIWNLDMLFSSHNVSLIGYENVTDFYRVR